jgi:hypothetical protein
VGEIGLGCRLIVPKTLLGETTMTTSSKDRLLWSPKRQVLLRLEGSPEVKMELGDAASFLQCFGARALILNLDRSPLATSDEADVLIATLEERYSPSA